MKVTRIVANITATDPSEAQAFYKNIFDLDLLMDLGWINTFGSEHLMPVQLSVASQGGSDTTVPQLSIEVDSLQEVLDRVKSFEIPVEYGPVIEPWGVHRFYIKDPFGTLINVLQHET